MDDTGLCVVEGSTWVPAVERMPGMSLPTRDRVTAKALLPALVPGPGDERSVFTDSVQNVFGILGHNISARMAELMTQGGHRSWKELASQVDKGDRDGAQ